MAHDNRIGFNEPESVFCLAHDFWAMFADKFGCDYVIQVRKYDRIESIVKQPTVAGLIYSAYNIIDGAHFEPMKKKLESMNIKERCEKEMQHMDSL